eukprot:CAMPEP_0117427754 /NCGR_PEP_ID=MMETSP0758-20121206/7562_1 /TAXON_ID=63605 /ORGANISM="Percolomonas cosmopolitus, Strain AE-1 (ATCC 50343)" /LENGTH=179 /DNA_ID=CAMNT_0005213627 /DNA_START=647 /DNA_END=1186 /DNA_ORIENTATION=+
MDQIIKIFKVMGTPTPNQWEKGLAMGKDMGYAFPTFPKQDLAKLMPKASKEAIELISDLLQLNPAKRPTAQQALQYPFFKTKLTIKKTMMPLDYQLTHTSERPAKRNFHQDLKYDALNKFNPLKAKPPSSSSSYHSTSSSSNHYHHHHHHHHYGQTSTSTQKPLAAGPADPSSSNMYNF